MILFTVATNAQEGKILWQTGLSAGVESYNRWDYSLYVPTFLIPGVESQVNGVSAVCQFEINGGIRLNKNWTAWVGLSLQHSRVTKEQNETWLGGRPRQDYFAVPVWMEYGSKRFFFELGTFLAYEGRQTALSHYPAGVVRSSRFHLGPLTGVGIRIPLHNALTLKIGYRATLGLLRYYNYGEQGGKPIDERSFNRVHAMPTTLIDVKLMFL